MNYAELMSPRRVTSGPSGRRDEEEETRGGDSHLMRLLTQPNVSAIDLTRSSLTQTGLSMLCVAIGHGIQITTLNLAGNSLGHRGGAAVVAALSTNKSLEMLDLSDNGMGDSGAKLMSKLSGHPRLRHLYLSHNSIGPQGADSVSLLLGTVAELRTLNLSFNSGIGDHGVNSLARALSNTGCRLEQLSLNYVGMGQRSALTLASALRLPQNTVTTLYCSGNPIGSAAGALSEAFEAKPDKKALVMDMGMGELAQDEEGLEDGSDLWT